MKIEAFGSNRVMKSKSAFKKSSSPTLKESMEKKLRKILNIKGIHAGKIFKDLSLALDQKTEKNYKKQALDFYLGLLRKIELLKFSLNNTEFNEKKLDPKCLSYSIEIDNVKIDNMDEKQCYASITAKYGKEYFSKLLPKH